ncbi:hypothetical protein BH11ACT8_BH11ACT8_04080 [soil metagenome]
MSAYLDVAEAGWRWVLAQVQRDEHGLWLPEQVPHDGVPSPTRDGVHSGVGGLGHTLAELRVDRALTEEEQDLADAVVERVRLDAATTTDADYFDGLAGHLVVLTVLGSDAAEAVVSRLGELLSPDGWPTQHLGPPRADPDGRFNDATLGTASVLLALVWAARRSVSGAAALALRTAEVLRAEAEPTPAGLTWAFVPRRYVLQPGPQMPNWSHGLAGIASALALAGAELGHPDLVDAARRGVEHLVTLDDPDVAGFAVPRQVPSPADQERHSWGWCHGPSGTSRVFAALEQGGVDEVAGVATQEWHRRCVEAVAASGLPERLRPGFWDNDGRCCGTAGVGEFLLDSFQRTGDERDLDLARSLGDVLVERAVLSGGAGAEDHAWWRFFEHTAEEPLLPPGTGWMQGAAGISAYLFRLARVCADGPEAPRVPRLDTWWVVRAGEPGQVGPV